MQWNAEGIYHKKAALTNKIHSENIDIVCVQETHLNKDGRFNVRGFEPYVMNRERHKGGVLFLVKNNLSATEFQIDTEDEAEIHDITLTVDNEKITIFNYYCPQDRQMKLTNMVIQESNTLVTGDFNSHSTSWGYETSDRRGEEVEDWQIDNNLLLLNDPDDPPTFYSRRWMTTSTPDLAFATGDIACKTTREVSTQLAGSDHKPIILQVQMKRSPTEAKMFPRWNYKKANWDRFTELTNNYCKEVKHDHFNINKAVKQFDQAVLKAAKESIPRGARKNFKPYWTKELQELEDELTEARNQVENEPTIDNNIKLKATEAKYRKTHIESARNSWKEKTEKLNLDREGHKLWKLAKAMNNEKGHTTKISVEKDEEIVTGRAAANYFAESYAEITNMHIPQTHKKIIKEFRQSMEIENESLEPEYMNNPFTINELEKCLTVLNNCKSPGPDLITNEMLKHLGLKAKKVLLKIFNNSLQRGTVPQVWKEANMIPIHKKGKSKDNVKNYRFISLTSCVGKVMERLINSRLTWYLEENQLLDSNQAGFRQHRSTEDQIAYIAQKIEDGFQSKKHTLAVWVDMEKAFDRVWRDGLRIKLKQIGVSGKMNKWISHYLNNRKTRTLIDGQYSRNVILNNGVSKGGVLSYILFLIFVNDLIYDLP